MIAVDVKATQDFSLPGDDTIFKLGLFDSALRNHFQKVLAKGQRKVPSRIMAEPPDVEVDPEVATQYMFDMVLYGLRGWDLKDADGKPVPFKTDFTNIAGLPGGSRQTVTLNTLDYLPNEVIVKLGAAIGNINFVREKEEKNSPPPLA